MKRWVCIFIFVKSCKLVFQYKTLLFRSEEVG